MPKAKSTRTSKREPKSAKVMTQSAPVMEASVPTPTAGNIPPVMSAKAPFMSSRVMRIALIVILAALITYKFGPWLFPAVVGSQPVSRFALWGKLEKAYGQATLDEMVNEKVLDSAIAKKGVKVDEARVQDQIKNLEKQFESVGGLDEALKQRGLTRADLEKQVRTQLSVEEILKDKINPTDDEIKADFESNKATVYKDKKIEDVREEIITRLKDNKLRDAFLEWFAEVKKEVNVKNFGL